MKTVKALSFILCALVVPTGGAHSFVSKLAFSETTYCTVDVLNARGSPENTIVESPEAWGIQLSDISVVDNITLFAVGRAKRDGEPEHAVVLGTSDGGKTWRPLLTHSDSWFYSVCFLTPRVGWVVGYAGLVVKTTDGGASWVKQHTAVDSSFVRIQMVDDKVGWVMARDGELLHTADGGRKWRSQKLKGHGWVSSNNSRKEFMGWLSSFHFSDNLNGWIVGGEANVYHSTDGGTTWESRGPSIVVNIPGWQASVVSFDTVKFLSAKVGFISATVRPKLEREIPPKGVLLKTEDGGVSWQVPVVTHEDSLTDTEILNDRDVVDPWVRGSITSHRERREDLEHN